MDEDSHSEMSLKNAMLDYLANSKVAYFKSQQVEEPELSFEQKRQIAEDILIRNPGQFLSRFGQFLESRHLDYFTEMNEMSENYEVTFYLQQLRRFHCKTTNEVIHLNSILITNLTKCRWLSLWCHILIHWLMRQEICFKKLVFLKTIHSDLNILIKVWFVLMLLCYKKKCINFGMCS
jgi:hypothetical protein